MQMKMRLLTLLATLLILPSSLLADQQEWRFRVFLDKKEIGYHNFYIQEFENETRLQSEASFEYRMLFVKLYGYEHENLETWQGDCLIRIESRTDANGKPFQVSGALEGESFTLRATAGDAELPPCNMSFAYWNPAFLQQKRLINTQNGAVIDVDVSEPELVELSVRGVMQPAFRYLLGAGELKIELWYSEDNEWLALETEAKGGRRLRYQLL
jgi:hypothetical protein